MTLPSSDELFRTAAEAEGGEAVSAGARVSHVLMAVSTGRTLQIDLTRIPNEKRAAVVAEISELVRRAESVATGSPLSPTS